MFRTKRWMQMSVVVTLLMASLPLQVGAAMAAPGGACAVDYSWSRPTLDQLAWWGCRGVLRYVDIGNTGKEITRSELNLLRGSGYEVGFILERWADRAAEGYEAGREDAIRATTALDRLGLTDTTVVYWAVDWDASWLSVVGYAAGWASVRSRVHTGVYGSVRITAAARSWGIPYEWATAAWRYGQTWGDAQIRQTQFLSNVDINDLIYGNWGQIGTTGTVPAETIAGNPTGLGIDGVTTYTVRPGDVLSGAPAAQCGIGWQELARINGLSDPNRIYPGQVLTCKSQAPSAAPSVASYTVQSGDVLSGRPSAFCGQTWQSLAATNSLSNPNRIFPGQVLRCSGAASPANGGIFYRAVPGDTAGAIASRNGISLSRFVALNGIANPNLIYAGRSYRIG